MLILISDLYAFVCVVMKCSERLLTQKVTQVRGGLTMTRIGDDFELEEYSRVRCGSQFDLPRVADGKLHA